MKRATTFAVIAVLLTGLTACSPAPPDPDPTLAPIDEETVGPVTSPPDAPLEPAFVEFDADSVSVTATTGDLMVDVGYSTAPATAVELLTENLDLDPVTSSIAATGCSEAATVWDWGGFRVVAPAPRGAELGSAAFIARATGPTTTNGLDVLLAGADPVGASLADVVAHGSGVSQDLGDGYAVGLIDGQAGNTWGVILVGQGGIVTSAYAPGFLASDDSLC